MIFFKKQHEAYVNVGTYKVQKTYAEGYVHVQGLGLQGVDNTPRTLDAKPLPGYFNLDWAQFSYPAPAPADVDAAQGVGLYDKGAFQVGVPVFDKTFLDVPRFRKVTLLYMHDTSITNESRTLVQFDPREYTMPVTVNGTQLDAAAYLDYLTSRVFTQQEYVEFVAVQGFNRTGTLLPKGISKSVVSELSSLRGDLVDPVTGDTIAAGVVIHVTPLYIQNSLPMFDAVYMENEELVEVLDGTGALVASATNVTNVPSRLLRWRGGFTSDYRAPINYDGASLPIGNGYAGFEPVFPRAGVVIDGVTYAGFEEYNVVNKPLG